MTNSHLCASIVLLLLVLAASATRWEFHAWNFDTNQPVSQSDGQDLPIDEDQAFNLICSSLARASAQSVEVGTMALSGGAFHPALNRVCRMAGLPCVYTSPGLQPYSALWKSPGTVEFYPHRDLQGAAISEFVAWSRWTRLGVIYAADNDLAKFKETLLSSVARILFKKVDVLNKDSTFVTLSELRQDNVFNFIIDVPQDQLPIVLQLATAAGVTSVSHSYLHIGWISPAMYNESVSTLLYGGCNFTAMHLGGWQAGADYPLELSEEQRLRRKTGEILASAYETVSLARSDWGARVEPLSIDAGTIRGSACNVSRISTGKFQEAVAAQIGSEIGVLKQSDTQTLYNFSFDVFHFYTSKVLKFATWTADHGFRQVSGAYEKHMEQFEQYLKHVNFTVVSVEDPPFSIYREVGEDRRPLIGNDRWTGFAVELFKEIARRMRLRYEIRRSVDGKFGSPVEGTDGKQWNGMIGELIKGTAHLAVASMTITYDREKVVDFTTPYMSLGLSVIMKKSAQEPDMFQFLLPFSNRVWLYMLLAWLLTSIVMYFCARLSPYEWYAPSACDPVVQNQFNAMNSLWFTIGSLMQQGSDLAPVATSTRMVGSVWWFFTLILISSYTANLAAFLTVTRLNDISSLGDLAGQTNIKYGTLLGGSTYNFFKNSDISPYKSMWESMSTWAKTNQSFVSKTSEGIERVRRGGYAYIIESTFNTYYRERDCSLLQVGEMFNPMSYAFGINQGNVVMRDWLTEEILKLQKELFIEGLTDKWLKRYNVSHPCSEQARGSEETGTLDVDAVGGVFVSLLIGLTIAAIFCVIEFVVKAVIDSGKRKGSFRQIALSHLRLATSCASTKPASDQDETAPAESCSEPPAHKNNSGNTAEKL